jgi:hypothetical protein
MRVWGVRLGRQRLVNDGIAELFNNRFGFVNGIGRMVGFWCRDW